MAGEQCSDGVGLTSREWCGVVDLEEVDVGQDPLRHGSGVGSVPVALPGRGDDLAVAGHGTPPVVAGRVGEQLDTSDGVRLGGLVGLLEDVGLGATPA